LDVRDLTFRAYVTYGAHRGGEGGYKDAEPLLESALRKSPDDKLALVATATINLCDCISAWSTDVAKETAIGIAAVDTLTRVYPTQHFRSLRLKALTLRGRYAEVLSISEEGLKEDPDDVPLLEHRIVALIHVGRAKDALPLVKSLQAARLAGGADRAALIAAAEYAAGNYAQAAEHARAAVGAMSEADLKSPVIGAARLTLAAAEARVGRSTEAREALQDFWTAVPNVRSIAQIRQWMYPTADLYGFEPLFEGLKLAGVSD
jgi:tetratricopeptide (TPR) repeat protein